MSCTLYSEQSSDQTGEMMKIILPNGKIITVETAETDFQRAQGLMFRKNLANDTGMLFIFDEEDFHSFWMKNTLISLDMIWIDSDFRIMYFAQNVPPCKSDPCPSYQPMFKARYVLEVNAGFVKQEKLKLDDKLKFETVR